MLRLENWDPLRSPEELINEVKAFLQAACRVGGGQGGKK